MEGRLVGGVLGSHPTILAQTWNHEKDLQIYNNSSTTIFEGIKRTAHPMSNFWQANT